MEMSDRPVPMLQGEDPGRPVPRSDALRWMLVYLELVRGLDDLISAGPDDESAWRLRRVRKVYRARAEFWRQAHRGAPAERDHEGVVAGYPL